MMIRMRVMDIFAVRIPLRHFGPGFSAVSSEMQVHAAAKDMIRALRMHRDCVPVRNLTFCLEMTAANLLPLLTSVSAAENAQQPIAQAVLSKGINDVWI